MVDSDLFFEPDNFDATFFRADIDGREVTVSLKYTGRYNTSVPLEGPELDRLVGAIRRGMVETILAESDVFREVVDEIVSKKVSQSTLGLRPD